MNTPKPESERAAAARLSSATGLHIVRNTVRRLVAKGIDLKDADAVSHALAMQERKPRPIGSAPDSQPKTPTNQPPTTAAHRPLNPEELDSKIAELQAKLLDAPDYQTARAFRVQISGVRELFKLQVDRGDYEIASEVEADGLAYGLFVKSLWENLEDELPPQLEGLTAMQMKVKLREFSRLKVIDIHEFNP